MPAVSGCVLISAFAALVDIPIVIAARLKVCASTLGIEIYQSIIKKAKKKHKAYEALIVSYINHGKYVSVKNVRRKHNDMKEENKNLYIHMGYTI